MSGDDPPALTPPAGGQDGFTITMKYIVARKRAEQALGFLAESGKVLAASLDLEETIGQVVDFAVPFLGDWCRVDLVTPDGAWQTVATAQIDGIEPSLSEGLDCALHPQGGDAAWASSPQRETLEIDISRQFGLRGVLVRPLLARGHGVGAIALVATDAGWGRGYGASDVAVAEELARRIASAVEIARLHQTIRQLRGS